MVAIFWVLRTTAYLKAIMEVYGKYFQVGALLVILINATVVPTKNDSDVIFCLQLLSKTLTCTLHLS